MLKTYAGDYRFVERLLEGFHKHNLDNLKVFLVAPREDLTLFRKLSHPNIVFIAEQEVPCQLLPEGATPREAGYINQQVLKLSFHRINLVENYLCLDSDGIFIRDFSIRDFVHEDGQPYQVLVEDNLLKTDSDYFDRYWKLRAEAHLRIKEFLGIEQSKLKTCHGFQIMQSEVLRGFERDILAPKSLEFVDLIQEFGYEFTWYNYFLQKHGGVIHESEPFFATVHTGAQLVELQTKGTATIDFTRGYIGLVVNGNFQHFRKPASLESTPLMNAVAYMRLSKLFALSVRFSGALLLRAFLTPVLAIRRILQRVKASLRS